jgi:diadenylate cyclase
MENMKKFAEKYLTQMSLPSISILDIIEIGILTVLIYHVILWIRDTRAWNLCKGLVMLFFVYVLSYMLQWNVILWLFSNTMGVGITALLVIFQPELRRALEQLGKQNIKIQLFSTENENVKNERYSQKTVQELVRACAELGKAKTGALIVIEMDMTLGDYERTGIIVDAVVTSQLLINIFEHNTPLHDGAVLIRGDRITSATCYLPLSDNMELSKELGTRHRAGVGVSEMTDSITLIVSEETGGISVAIDGKLRRNVTTELLKEILMEARSAELKKIKLFRKSRKKGKD